MENIKDFKRIAHAWWIYAWEAYTNSMDALNENKDHYNLFEMDFSWTNDNELVCIHDWWLAFENSFWFSLNKKVPSYDEFLKYIEG